jgi:hypothetical protein
VNDMTDEYILGGYFIVKAASRGASMNPLLLPEKIVTVSDCICDILPGTWALSWVTKHTAEQKLKKHFFKGDFELLENWLTDLFDKGIYGWQGEFNSLDAAREFCERFLISKEDIYLLGIGLTVDDAAILIEEEMPNGKTLKSMICKVLSKKETMLSENLLGFDVLGYEFDSFHSYICNGLESDFYKRYGYEPNNYGLYDTFTEAKKSADYVMTGDIGAEPVLWQPWAVSRFDL